MSQSWLIDTHCHLNLGQYDDDYQEVIDESLQHNTAIIVPGCDLASSKKGVEIADVNTGKPLWAAVGQHPTETGEEWDEKVYGALARSDRVVAIGEIGLDYFHLPQETLARDSAMIRQKELLQSQLDLAHEVGKPVLLHCRDAHDELLEFLLHQYGLWTGGRERGVVHCFTAGMREARSYLDLGFLISFTGIITFTDEYDTVIAGIPLEKLMIETDAPFLTPVPYRGKRNHPRYVEYIARKLADVKCVTLEAVATQTSKNAHRLFGITV